MSAFLCLDREVVVSFSPERFVRLRPHNTDDFLWETFPIKGTRPRHAHKDMDAAMKNELTTSAKDRAELNMIVDLMRHDLARVSQRGSVQVVEAGTVRAHETVYHRHAHLCAVLRSHLSLQECLAWLLPAGSITGAPKKEVIEALQDLEPQPRGYMMGNIIYLAPSGVFDSSVLIRTLHIHPQKGALYAAGSGIVIGSEPETEWREVQAKCGMWAGS